MAPPAPAVEMRPAIVNPVRAHEDVFAAPTASSLLPDAVQVPRSGRRGSSEPWPATAGRMPHGHDLHEGVLLKDLEIDAVGTASHQDATDQLAPDHSVRQARLWGIGESIEDRLDFVVEELGS